MIKLIEKCMREMIGKARMCDRDSLEGLQYAQAVAHLADARRSLLETKADEGGSDND